MDCPEVNLTLWPFCMRRAVRPGRRRKSATIMKVGGHYIEGLEGLGSPNHSRSDGRSDCRPLGDRRQGRRGFLAAARQEPDPPLRIRRSGHLLPYLLHGSVPHHQESPPGHLRLRRPRVPAASPRRPPAASAAATSTASSPGTTCASPPAAPPPTRIMAARSATPSTKPKRAALTRSRIPKSSRESPTSGASRPRARTSMTWPMRWQSWP